MDSEMFAGFLVGQGLQDGTVRHYVPLARRLADHVELHGGDMLELEGELVGSWAQQLQVGRSTLAQARAMVGHWCAATGQQDLSDAVPVPGQRRRRVRALEDSAAGRLVAAAKADGGRKGLAVLVGLLTAARRSEIASLAWPRVDLDGGWVTLERRKLRDLHQVPLHPVLGEWLAARATATGASWSWSDHLDPWVFPGRNGGHVSPVTVWRWVRDVADEAGVDCTPHQLRHTALTLINDRTGNLRAAQDVAGHSSPDVTARYTRSTDERLHQAVGVLDW